MSESPTTSTLSLFAAVFLLQVFGGAIGLGAVAFALALPLAEHPWTIVLSVYAHGSLQHLAANTIALAVVGPFVAYVTTPVRYHVFFVVTGALSGVAQVVVTAPFGDTAVLGASGAIFAMMGYLVVGNRASTMALSWVPIGYYGRLALFALLAGLVTVATAAPGVAIVSHFTGLFLGMVAGRMRLLHVSRSPPTAGE